MQHTTHAPGRCTVQKTAAKARARGRKTSARRLRTCSARVAAVGRARARAHRSHGGHPPQLVRKINLQHRTPNQRARTARCTAIQSNAAGPPPTTSRPAASYAPRGARGSASSASCIQTKGFEHAVGGGQGRHTHACRQRAACGALTPLLAAHRTQHPTAERTHTPTHAEPNSGRRTALIKMPSPLGESLPLAARHWGLEDAKHARGRARRRAHFFGSARMRASWGASWLRDALGSARGSASYAARAPRGHLRGIPGRARRTRVHPRSCRRWAELGALNAQIAQDRASRTELIWRSRCA
jgi:hypothetical protein